MSIRAIRELANYWGGKHPREEYDGKVVVYRLPLDSGGYTKGSRRYYGTGEKLWEIYDDETHGDIVQFEIRASSKKAAKDKIKAAYPGVV